MKVSPPRNCYTICCGLFAIALLWSTTAIAQQNRSNPLRQPAGFSTPQQRASSPRPESAAVSQTSSGSTVENNTLARPTEAPYLVQQAAYQTSHDETGHNHHHQLIHDTSVLLDEPQALSATESLSEIHQKGVYQKGVYQKGVYQKGVYQKGVYQKGVFQKGVFQKGVFQKGGIVQKGGIAQKGGKGDCLSCNGGGCFHCCLPCIPFSLDNFEFFSGVQGFSGPANRGGTASFGFQEGFNMGMPMPCFNGCFGVQVGLRATHANFSGAGFPADAGANMLFTDETRNQIFLTTGIFRRVDWGLQGGIVFDYLSDDWYSDTTVAQLRGEASWVFPCAHELGFMFSAATDEDLKVSNFMGGGPLTEIWEVTDQYAFFYRHRPAYMAGAEARIFAGWSGDTDGIIGADLRLPLHDSLALELGFSYLIPEQARIGAAMGGHEEESWNMAAALVWYPGCRSTNGDPDYFRPLFGVADNGSLRVGRR